MSQSTRRDPASASDPLLPSAAPHQPQAAGTSVAATNAAPTSPGVPTARGRARAAIAVAVLLAVVALVVAVAGHGAPTAATPPPIAIPTGGLPAPARVAAAVGPMVQSVPVHVLVRSISASSSLIPVGVDAHNSIEVPPLSQPMQAGWYSKGPTPGALGPAVIVGHVNGDGHAGIFANLHNVQPGQEIDVDRADGQTAVFTVNNVETVPKDVFPTQRVYGNTTNAQLRLITCGGELDQAAHNYLSNVVVYATLTSTYPT